MLVLLLTAAPRRMGCAGTYYGNGRGCGRRRITARRGGGGGAGRRRRFVEECDERGERTFHRRVRALRRLYRSGIVLGYADLKKEVTVEAPVLDLGRIEMRLDDNEIEAVVLGSARYAHVAERRSRWCITRRRSRWLQRMPMRRACWQRCRVS